MSSDVMPDDAVPDDVVPDDVVPDDVVPDGVVSALTVSAPLTTTPATPARVRQVVTALRATIEDRLADGHQVNVLDCGGGSGTFAVPLAVAGATVTVVDISVDALATLLRRAADAGVAARVLAMQGDIESLSDVVGKTEFDVLLAHGVLEAVESPLAALDAMLGVLRPGGVISLLAGNPAAAVLARALAGDVVTALADLREQLADPQQPGPSELLRELERRGLMVETAVGVGVFSELIAGADLDAYPGSNAALADLEQVASSRSPYRDIAARIHIVARRPLIECDHGS